MKFQKKAYSYIIMMGHLCADISGGALPAILPFLMTEKGISYSAAAGLTFALSSIGSLIQPVFGCMADKTSRPWLMSLGIFMSGFGVSMLGLLDNYWAMFAAVAFTGIGAALFHPDGGRMANYVAGAKKGKGISLFSVGGNMGSALGPMLVVFGITMAGSLKGTLILTIPAITMAIFMVTQNSRFADFAEEGNRATKAAMAAGQKDDWHSFSRLAIVVFLRSTIQMGMNTFLPLFWLNVLMQSESRSGSVTTIIAFSGAIATLIGGRLADRFGFNKVIRSGLTVLIPCLLVLSVSRNVTLSTIMLIPTAMSLNMAFSPSVALGQKFIPNHIGLASGITMGLASSFGGMVSPLLGKVADSNGVSVILWILAGLAVLSCIASYFVPSAPMAVSVNPESREAGCHAGGN